MLKVDWKTIGKNAVKVGRIAAFGILAAGPSISIVRTSLDEDSVTVKYSDTVNAIMESDMWSSDKLEAVSVLKRNENADFYAAIISIVKKSDMWSSDKLEAIKCLNR